MNRFRYGLLRKIGRSKAAMRLFCFCVPRTRISSYALFILPDCANPSNIALERHGYCLSVTKLRGRMSTSTQWPLEMIRDDIDPVSVLAF